MAAFPRSIASFAVLILCAGCPRKPAADVPAIEDRGSVGYAFLVDPSAGHPAGHFVPPEPREKLPLPFYPPEVLAARATASVVVRILIDEEGRVKNVTDSPLEGSSPGPFAREFRAAVLRSLRHWRFTPGAIEQVEDGPDADADGKPDYRTTSSMSAVRVFYDVRFDFDVVSGEGRVRSSATP